MTNAEKLNLLYSGLIIRLSYLKNKCLDKATLDPDKANSK